MNPLGSVDLQFIIYDLAILKVIKATCKYTYKDYRSDLFSIRRRRHTSRHRPSCPSLDCPRCVRCISGCQYPVKKYRVCHRFRSTKQDDYFGSILTTFESSSIYGGSLGIIENWFETKTKPPSVNLACPNLSNALYVLFLT